MWYVIQVISGDEQKMKLLMEDRLDRSLYRKCTPHFIKTTVLEKHLTNEFAKLHNMVIKNRGTLENRLTNLFNNTNKQNSLLYKKTLEDAKIRLNKVNSLMAELYEDNKSGNVSQKQFEHLMNEYESQIDTAEEQIDYYENIINNYQCKYSAINVLLDNIEKYDDYTSISPMMLNDLIHKVVVHEGSGRGKNRNQKIDIYYNSVGLIDLDNL